MDEALLFGGAVEAGKAIARGKITAVALTEAMLARIERLEPTLHAYVRTTPETARAEAKRADAELKRGKSRGPLHGVPLAVKDLCDMAGQPTSAGIPMLAETAKTTDSTVVARLRAAGAVILGKLKLTEGAMALHHPEVAAPVNPWRADLWPGVSSSGSGVSVAAALTFGALGSDTGGSIRFPSQANAIVGLKPTWGRVSRAGVFPLAETLDHVGPMTRRVEDCAAILGAIAGRDECDPTSVMADVPNYMAGLTRGIAGAVIGYDKAWCSDDVDPAITAVIKRALAGLKKAGAVVKPVTMPSVAPALANWARLCVAEAAIGHSETYPARKDGYGPYFSRLLEAGHGGKATDYAAAEIARRNLRGGVDALFHSVDMMIVPVTPMLSGTLDYHQRRMTEADPANRAIRFTGPFNMSGHPTITLPGGFGPDGSAIGFQLVGGAFDEALLLRAGMAWQKAADWAGKRPPLAA